MIAQVGGVAEHLGQRHPTGDDLRVAPRLHLLHSATTRGDIADHISHVVLGSDHLDLHHRLQQHRVRLRPSVLESHRTGHLESHLGGVDIVKAAVVEIDLEAGHRIAGQRAGLHRLADTLLGRLDELPGDGSSGDLVVEHELTIWTGS